MKKLLLAFLLAIVSINSYGQITTPGGAQTALAHGSNTLAAPVIYSTVASSTAINLTWTSVQNTITYILQRSTDNTFTLNLTTLYTNTGNSYSDTGLATGTIYYYRVVAEASGYTTSFPGIIADMPGTALSPTTPTSTAIDSSGHYAAGTIFKFTSGTYKIGLNIQNLQKVVLDYTGVTLDGDSVLLAQYNILTAINLKSVIVKGLNTINCGYHAGELYNVNHNVVFEGMTYKNCQQSFNVAINFPLTKIAWDGTDSTIPWSELSWLYNTYDGFSKNVGVDGSCINISNFIANDTTFNLSKNILIAGSTFEYGNPKYVVNSQSTRYYNIVNNRWLFLNNQNYDDSRLVLIVGYGDYEGNYGDHCRGHMIGVLSVSHGDTIQTSHILNNIYLHGYRYALAEYQPMSQYATPYTVGANLIMSNNTAGDLGQDLWYPIGNRTFYCSLIDIYPATPFTGTTVTVNNNLGFNWFNPPNVAGGIYWNDQTPTTHTGNVYVSSISSAIDYFYNSLYPGAGAQ